MTTRVGVITFPGTLDDRDAATAVTIAGAQAQAIWHKEKSLKQVDAVILPGGFSYGDYMRTGALASLSPIMEAVVEAAKEGMPVLGICNGFQMLCETGLLPGVLTRNTGLHFICRPEIIKIESNTTAWTNSFEVGEELLIPVKNGEGCFQVSSEGLAEIEAKGLVVARYQDNPNGSVANIAALRNAQGNVVGIMPHPEHAVDSLVGPSIDGLGFFWSIAGVTI
ncbi:MAG: phosphoribosylformylglycinamidine synthase i purq [Actinomycetota bacterium]